MKPQLSAEELATMGIHEITGQVLQVTIKSSGNLFFERVNSLTVQVAESRGWSHQILPYRGACLPERINELVHRGLSVIINGVSTAEFKDLIATPEECLKVYN
jgi:hypothetical protein